MLYPVETGVSCLRYDPGDSYLALPKQIFNNTSVVPFESAPGKAGGKMLR